MSGADADKRTGEVKRYFGRPGFARFLEGLERRYTSSRQGVRGYVELPDITDEERETLDEFYQMYSRPLSGKLIRYSLKKFEQLLLDSRFGLTVPQLLELLNGRPVRTLREQEEQTEAVWRDMIASAVEQVFPERGREGTGRLAAVGGTGGEFLGEQGSAVGTHGADDAGTYGAAYGGDRWPDGAGESSGSGERAPQGDDGANEANGADGVNDGTDGAESAIRSWAHSLLEETGPGSRTLRLVFGKSPQEARMCLLHCLKALRLVRMSQGHQPIRLPVLAAQVTGDAHALDWKYPLGRLFWWGLTGIADSSKPAVPASSPLLADGLANVASSSGESYEAATLPAVPFREDEEAETGEAGGGGAGEVGEVGHSQAVLIREGYRRGGVADDDLSSQVLLYAPDLLGVREERVLTLRQVEGLAAERERIGRLSAARILMVENPSVFAEWIDADLRNRDESRKCAAEDVFDEQEELPVMLCGNGQPSVAVIRLLDALLGGSGERQLYYAGDMDPAGIGIAHALQLRYPFAFRAWCMNEDVYRRYADRGIRLTASELARLRELRCEWDDRLIQTMLAVGVKLHQELWLDELLRGEEQAGRLCTDNEY